MRRLGVLGGTFDPVHIGHLVAAVNARHALHLDRVLLVVANDPWQKSGTRAVTPAADRLAMVEAAVRDVDGLEASAVEILRGGPSFTVDTLESLAAPEGDAQLFLIVGADVVPHLSTWHRHDDVRRLATLVIVDRPGALPPDDVPGWSVERVDIPGLDVSSTDLRARAADGRPHDYLVPPAALHCIRQRGLYADGR